MRIARFIPAKRSSRILAASIVILLAGTAGAVAWRASNTPQPLAQPTPSSPVNTPEKTTPVEISPEEPVAQAPTPAPVPVPTPIPAPTQTHTPAPVPAPTPSSTDSYSVVVNKKHPNSPLTYTPSDLVAIGSQRLRSAPAAAIRQMQADSGANVPISPASGYRSYQTQTTLYNSYVAKDGQATADTYSARPGYSEHQTGLAMDFSPIDASFASTNQYSWLQQNAYRYGFVLRYPNGKTAVTGYMYEPWHWRYVGVSTATDMHNRGITTLEEYFGVTGGNY